MLTRIFASPPLNQAFHGWKILFLAFVCQMVSVGFTMYLIGLYIEPLATTFGASIGQLGWSSSIFLLVASALGPLLGSWVDKGKARLILTLGAACLGSGFIALSQAGSIFAAALACTFLIAPGASMLGIVTVGAMLVQWFEKYRGLAVGIAAAGISVGGFLMPPIVAALFASVGWRMTSLILGSIVLVALLPTVWLLAISRPSEIGQFPDGVQRQETGRPLAASPVRVGFRALFGRRDFWIISITLAAINFSSIMILNYLVPHVSNHGIGIEVSAFVLSAYAASAFTGKFISGWLCDRLQPRLVFQSLLVFSAIGLIPMILLEGIEAFFLSAILLGLSQGGLMPVWASLIAAHFGAENFGTVKGTMTLLMTSIVILPGPIGGYFHDLNGSYNDAFELVFFILVFGILVSTAIPRHLDVCSKAVMRPT